MILSINSAHNQKYQNAPPAKYAYDKSPKTYKQSGTKYPINSISNWLKNIIIKYCNHFITSNIPPFDTITMFHGKQSELHALGAPLWQD